jgi:hypothetical protein
LIPCDTERLAWEAPNDDINHALIASGIPLTEECSDITEDWGFVKVSVFDSCFDNTLAIAFPFDISKTPHAY